MMRAEDWVCFVCVGNESKDVRCMFIENKDLDRLEKEEEYLVERAKNEQKRMVNTKLAFYIFTLYIFLIFL